MTTAQDNFENREVVILGACTLQGGSKGVRVGLVSLSDPATFEAIWYMNRKIWGMNLGAVYEVPCDLTAGTMRTARRQIVRMWSGDLLEWQAKHDAHIVREKAVTREKTLTSSRGNDLVRCLEPIKAVRAKLSWADRAAFDMVVLEYLRR